MAKEREVWKGDEQAACVNLCAAFRKQGVGFRVEQHAFTYSKDDMTRMFTIHVPEEFYEEAKAIVAEQDRIVVTEEDGNDGEGGGDDNDEAATIPQTPEVRARRERPPHSEKDMNVEVWRDTGETKYAEYVKLSLRENAIGCRVAEERGGDRVFVAAEDEKPAREIVRELRGDE
jgi:hypothetical protein